MPDARRPLRRRDRVDRDAPLPGVDRLRTVVRDSFGIELGALEQITGGLDARASVWHGHDAEGHEYGVKASLRDTRFGLAVADSLTRSGVEGVVAPARTADGMPWAVDAGVVVSVGPWITGWDATEPGSRLQWERFGRTLRAVHDHQPPETAVAPRRGIRRSPRSPARLVGGIDRVLGPTAHPGAGPGDSADSGESADSGDLADLAERWQAVRDRLLRLVRVERQLKRVRLPTARVTLHGDPHLGNVVVDDQGNPWLIDFDEAAVAPREADLMLVELGVLFSSPITPAEREAFRRGYGDIDVDAERIARFGCVRAVEDTVATFRQAIGAKSADRTQYDGVIDGLTGPHGLVSLVEDELDRLGMH